MVVESCVYMIYLLFLVGEHEGGCYGYSAEEGSKR